MRVLINVEQLRRAVPGGIGTYARGLLQGLVSYRPDGVDVVLLASASSKGRADDPLGSNSFPLELSKLPSRLLTRAWDKGMPAPSGFDLVQSVSLAGPHRGGAPRVVTVHDLAWREFPEAFPGRGRRWHEAALKRAMAHAAGFVVPSEATAESLEAAGAKPELVHVVEEGSDHLVAPDDTTAERLLTGHGIKGPFICCISTLEPRKNLARLVEGYAAARSRMSPPLPLLVVGPIGWGPALGPAPGVVLAGHVSDPVLSGLLRRAQFLAYVPLGEGFGLPPLEAMGAGVPVMASPMPSLGGAALVIDPKDPASISDALARMASDAGLRQRLIDAGRARARSLTWERAARRHVEVWHGIASRSIQPKTTVSSPWGGAEAPNGPPADLGSTIAATPEAPLAGELRVVLDVSAVPERPGGAGHYVIELVRILGWRSDLSLSLLCGKGDSARWRELAPSAAVQDAVPRTRPLRLTWEQLRMPRAIAKLGADLVHSPHYTMPRRTTLPRRAAIPRRPTVPRVVTIHDLTFFDHPEWHQRSKVWLFRNATARAAKGADAIICVSPKTAGRLVELFPRAADKVVVVPHGVNTDRFNPNEPEEGFDAAVLDQHEISTPYLLYVGTIEPRKDVPTLVQAFDRVAATFPELNLVLAGAPGWGSQAVGQAISNSRHGDRVILTEYLPDSEVPALLRRAAAAVYPSRSEGFGLPALEALACGAPLVTTSGTVMEEVSSGAAWLFAPGDVGELAGALQTVLTSQPEDLSGRRRRGTELVSRHSWSTSAEAHVAIYRRLAALSAAGQVSEHAS